MRSLIRALLILALAVFAGLPLHAQQADAPVPAAPALTPAQTLDQLDGQIDTVERALRRKGGTPAYADLRGTALSVQDQARQLVGALTPQMAALDAQLQVLGPAPARGEPPEAAAVAAQRRQLDRAQASLDAQIKQAQLVAQNAGRLATQIIGLRNDQFQARLTSRTPTPFSHAFWTAPIQALPDDLARVGRLGTRWGNALATAWQPANRGPLLWCLIGAVLLLGGGRWLLERIWLRLTTRRVPDGHLRRSAMAAAVALTAVVTTGLAAELVYLGIDWNDILDDDLDTTATKTVHLIVFAAYVTGLGRALLSVRRPSWRLPELSDLAARRLRPFPWLLAATALAFGLFDVVTRNIGSSLPATVTVRGLIALLLSALIGAALWRLHVARRAHPATEAAEARQPLWVGVFSAAAILGVIVTWLSVATGFIALAYFIALQMLWIGVIVASTYLLIQLLRDTFTTLLAPHGRSGERLQAAFGIAPGTLAQAAVILSGASRIALALVALTIVLAPYGAGPSDLLASATQTLAGLKLGTLPIEPGTIFTAAAVLVVGLVLLHFFKRWLAEELLPHTAMEPGMQSSIVTLLGYLGGLLVIVLTLAALRVDLKSITWIVSALSVGIGFGLQAIVQNFISGLILLVERPVKVGDWISLGDVEGNIRHINVRATEIQLFDRSTVIVPNSQLVTENVRNVTWGNALGRVFIRLPLSLDADASRVRTLLLDVLRAHPATLDTPAPSVALEKVDASAMTFNCIAYVASPRDVYDVKSDLLFAALECLRNADMAPTSAQSLVVRTLGPAPAAGGP